MNEVVLLSNKYISKESFLNEIMIEGYHLELGGDNDQLWLIANDVEKCEVVINLIFQDENGNVIEDEIEYQLSECRNLPYEGFLYSLEYKNSKLLNKLLKCLNVKERNLFIEYNGSGKFEKV